MVAVMVNGCALWAGHCVKGINKITSLQMRKLKPREVMASFWSHRARNGSADTLHPCPTMRSHMSRSVKRGNSSTLNEALQKHTHSRLKGMENVLLHIPTDSLLCWITGYFRTSPSSLDSRNIKFGNVRGESLSRWACQDAGLLGFGWKLIGQNQSLKTH